MQINQSARVFNSIEETERQEFGLGDASVILMLLTQQYSKPIQTLVQEYICNGRDANREIGSVRPLDITVPSSHRNIFEVRDYGPGISPENMVNIFIKIGASTKRDDNKMTGGFGIGAKSAWAYSDKFNIIVFQKGKKRTYVAHYSADPENPSIKRGYLDLIKDPLTESFEEDTDEPDGTLIQVPCKQSDVGAFRDAIVRTIGYWPLTERPKVIRYIISDGKGLIQEDFEVEYPRLTNAITGEYSYKKIISGEEQTQTIKYTLELTSVGRTYYSGTKDYIVIDSIPYKIPWESRSYPSCNLRKLEEFLKKFFILRLENGNLWIPPTREALSDDEHNKKLVYGILDQALQKIKDSVESRFQNISSVQELLSEANSVLSAYNFDRNITYEGLSVDLSRGALKYNEVTNWHYRLERENLKETKTEYFEANSTYFYLDVDMLSDRQIKMRIKQHLKELRQRNCYLFRGEKQKLDNLRAEFPGVEISSIVLTRTPSTPRSKDRFAFHKVRQAKGGGNDYKADSTDLLMSEVDEFEQEVIYLPLSERSAETDRRFHYLSKVLPHMFGYVSETVAAKLALKENCRLLSSISNSETDFEFLKNIEGGKKLSSLFNDILLGNQNLSTWKKITSLDGQLNNVALIEGAKKIVEKYTSSANFSSSAVLVKVLEEVFPKQLEEFKAAMNLPTVEEAHKILSDYYKNNLFKEVYRDWVNYSTIETEDFAAFFNWFEGHYKSKSKQEDKEENQNE